MRLTKYEQKAIKQLFIDVFGDGEIYLFGSRTDDNKRGGDIDLYLCPTMPCDDVYEKKIAFLVNLEVAIGEQKIDAIMARDASRPIEQVAIRDGIQL